MSRIRIVLSIIVCSCVAAMHAQSGGTSSSYSRFGMGLLNDQSQSFNRNMGGVGQGLRYGTRVNKQNPASYSAIDSLSFILDVGMSLQRTRYSLDSEMQTYDNTAFDHISAGWRIFPHVGMSIGVVPFSSIGYNFSQQNDVVLGIYNQQTATQTISYYGDGGLHDAYLGVGWEPLKNISIGANIGYMWGNVNHQVLQSFAENGTSSSSYSSLSTYYKASLKTWKAELGVQYQYPLNADDELTLGATVGLGHKIGSDASLLRTTQSGDTIQQTVPKAFQLPMTYSIGAAWRHDQQLTIAADVTYEPWASCTAPQLQSNGIYAATKDAYKNHLRVNAGVEYVPERYSPQYHRRVNYRAGLYYSSPYMKVNGADGPREYGITAGLGLPIQNSWNNRSTVNIGVQWVRREAGSNLITENQFRINVSITFCETWFHKWKFL